MSYVPKETLDWAIEQRNDWIKLFNRLDAAVSRWRDGITGDWTSDNEDALIAAHDRVLKSAAKTAPRRAA